MPLTYYQMAFKAKAQKAVYFTVGTPNLKSAGPNKAHSEQMKGIKVNVLDRGATPCDLKH